MFDAFDRLHDELASMSEGLGFVEAEPPEPTGGEELPPGASTWQSEFATLLVVPVAPLDEDALSRVTAAGEAWLRDHIDAEELQGRLVDGYLLIAVPRQPTGSIAGSVDRVEQNPYTCRKHVLWPEHGSWRGRLLRVTTLSLPHPPPAVVAAADVGLPLAAERILELCRDSNSTEATVEKLRAYAAQVAAGTGAG